MKCVVGGALLAAFFWNSFGAAQERTVAASGLWRADHPRKTAYLCIDHNFQPWRLLPTVISGPPVGEGGFREGNGGLVSYSVRLERRDWVEGGVYISESRDTVRYSGAVVDGERVSSEGSTVVRRSWQGDFAKRLEFRERRQIRDSGNPEPKTMWLQKDSAVMTRIGPCPASLVPGQKCEVLSSPNKGSSEWPACDATLGRSSR